MPELPEVETVRRGLVDLVKDDTIEDVDTYYDKMLSIPSKDKDLAKGFNKTLQNKKILTIDRQGKYLLFKLSGNLTLVSHLRMEGKYEVKPKGSDLRKHTYVVFHLKSGRDLRYNDTRKFGRMVLIKTGEENLVSGLSTLGPEPSELTFNYLKTILKSSKRKIKALLLDQSKIAGLGNIYADEVLWLSRIHPETLTNTINDKSIRMLLKNIQEEITLAIKHHGTTVHSYTNAKGKAGDFQAYLHVYGKKGKLCERCQKTELKKIKVAQRGTTFCPTCQQVITEFTTTTRGN